MYFYQRFVIFSEDDKDSAAMSLKCGGICNDHFVANFMLSAFASVGM